jgi:hypothetical protein
VGWGRGLRVAVRPTVPFATASFNRRSLVDPKTLRPYNRLAMSKPPITISCECGETRDVSYGERWRCERCGRSWNTQQIPAEEYEGLLRRMRRHRLEVLVVAAIAAAVLIPLIVVVSSRFILLIPMVMAAWLFLVLPFWRRRYRRTARDAPRWELHPE